MLMPATVFGEKLSSLAHEARITRRVGVARVYEQASRECETIFANRSFGEAVAQGTREFQLQASEPQPEDERLAWLRVVSELAQLLQDFS